MEDSSRTHLKEIRSRDPSNRSLSCTTVTTVSSAAPQSQSCCRWQLLTLVKLISPTLNKRTIRVKFTTQNRVTEGQRESGLQIKYKRILLAIDDLSGYKNARGITAPRSPIPFTSVNFNPLNMDKNMRPKSFPSAHPSLASNHHLLVYRFIASRQHPKSPRVPSNHPGPRIRFASNHLCSVPFPGTHPSIIVVCKNTVIIQARVPSKWKYRYQKSNAR
jgi:hypothetical protein